MRLYISKTHDRLNGQPFKPETINRNICLNPLYKATVSDKTNVLLDSGAFQDVKTVHRLSFQAALNRQLKFEEEQGFNSELLVSYDRLVDEKYDKQLGQIKQRVSYRTAEKYVEETIDAAKFLVDQRSDLKPRRLVLSNQGVSVYQYLKCVKEILKFSNKTDIIGFGGFCIVGLKPYLKRQYYDVLQKSLPLIKKKGVTRVHIFGIGTFDVLVRTHFLCRSYGIEPSYDTSAYELRGIMGQVCNPSEVVAHSDIDSQKCPLCKTLVKMPAKKLEKMRLSQTFFKEDKFCLYPPVDTAMFNIKLVNYFWEELNKIKVPRLFD